MHLKRVLDACAESVAYIFIQVDSKDLGDNTAKTVRKAGERFKAMLRGETLAFIGDIAGSSAQSSPIL